MTAIRSISEVLIDLKTHFKSARVSLEQVLEALHERGFGFVILIFALPMAMPIPVPPGVNIILATPLLFLTAQQALGRHKIWVPARLKKKTITRSKLFGMIDGTLPWVLKLEHLLKPRMGYITRGAFSNLIGVLGFIMTLAVCIPLPMTNTVPSLGITLMALGVIMRDGLAVLAGAVIGGLWVTMLAAVFILVGAEGLDMLKEAIKSFLI